MTRKAVEDLHRYLVLSEHEWGLIERAIASAAFREHERCINTINVYAETMREASKHSNNPDPYAFTANALTSMADDLGAKWQCTNK
jgi:hypothetical protein